MAMDNGRAGLGCIDGGRGNLSRSNRNGGMFTDRIAGAGHGTGDSNFKIHSFTP